MKTIAEKPNTKKFEPVLRKILTDAKYEHREIEMMFRLIGWGDLPNELKMEIKDDVKGYVDELNGTYSTCDPYVQRRRESVDFWVHSFSDGICTLDTAVKALCVRSVA